MADEIRYSRRRLLTTGGATLAAGLSGCLFGGDNTDATETQTPPEQSDYEPNESDLETQFEGTPNGFFEGWLEFETPTEQIPRENYTIEEYPSLQVLEGFSTVSEYGMIQYDII